MQLFPSVAVDWDERDREMACCYLQRVLTLSDQRKMLETQNNRMQHKLKAVNEDFRLRLIKFVEDAAVSQDLLDV